MSDPHVQGDWIERPAAHAAAMTAGGSRPLARLLARLYRFKRLRRWTASLVLRLEGGIFFSATYREIMRRWHKVDIGRYSYGDIMKPGCAPPGTRFGPWCSIGGGLVIRRRDHPIERPTMHPFFYNNIRGFLRTDTIPYEEENPLTIGHDVWIGDRVTIVSGCKSVGEGAVIAAGAVVVKDVAPYSIVGGVPAKRLKMRFDPETIARLTASRWWERDLEELMADPDLLLMRADSLPDGWFGTNRPPAPDALPATEAPPSPEATSAPRRATGA